MAKSKPEIPDYILKAEELAAQPPVYDHSKPIVEQDDEGNDVIVGHELVES